MDAYANYIRCQMRDVMPNARDHATRQRDITGCNCNILVSKIYTNDAVRCCKNTLILFYK